MSAVILLTFLAAAPPAIDARLLVQTEERLELPARGALTLEVDALDKTVTLRGAAARALLGASHGTLCPTATASRERVTLHCSTTHLAAHLERDASGGRALVLAGLRGLPWQPGAEGPPRTSLLDAVPELQGACPGATAPVQAECAFLGGHLNEAQPALAGLLSGPLRDYALLRLGDLALMRDQPAAAAESYQAIGPGPFSRSAAARLGELFGRCDSACDPLDGAPAPLALDLRAHALRRLAFEGQLEDAARTLEATPGLLSDRYAAPFSRRVLLSLLNAARRGQLAPAPVLRLYFRAAASPASADRRALLEAAAALCEQLGAPRFAAALLASENDAIPPPELAAHLQRTAQLYAQAGDLVRAGVVRSYAAAHLGEAAVRRWRLQPPSRLPAEHAPEAPEADEVLERAHSLLTRARDVESTEGVP